MIVSFRQKLTAEIGENAGIAERTLR